MHRRKSNTSKLVNTIAYCVWRNVLCGQDLIGLSYFFLSCQDFVPTGNKVVVISAGNETQHGLLRRSKKCASNVHAEWCAFCAIAAKTNGNSTYTSPYLYTSIRPNLQGERYLLSLVSNACITTTAKITGQ